MRRAKPTNSSIVRYALIPLLLALIYNNCNLVVTSYQPPNIEDQTKEPDIAMYFIVIHNEPLPDPAFSELTLEKSYETLVEIVSQADQYNQKLTLMFTAQWVDGVFSNSSRKAQLETWKANGHEIAAHHHEITHSLWDGYTNTSREKALSTRTTIRSDGFIETYLGTMRDYINKLKTLNPDIQSGCLNGDTDPNVLVDEIIYSTCTDFGNSGTSGQRVRDRDPKKGINEFVGVGTINGIERRYLSHAQVSNSDLRAQAEEIYESLDADVAYGVVAHSIEENLGTGDLEEAQNLMEFMKFLHEKDPNGLRSRTVSGLIQSNALPEIKASTKSH